MAAALHPHRRRPGSVLAVEEVCVAIEEHYLPGSTEPILTADEMRALLQDDEPEAAGEP